jgi:hypothetical protein
MYTFRWETQSDYYSYDTTLLNKLLKLLANVHSCRMPTRLMNFS